MSEAIAVPTAMNSLDRRLSEDISPEDLIQVLRLLQHLGLSKEDLLLHVERIRAINDVQEYNELLDDNCMMALDIIYGTGPVYALQWDPVEMARVHLPKTLNLEDLQRALTPALHVNDLLLPRKEFDDGSVIQEVIRGVADRLTNYATSMNQAEFFRVPKAGFVSRPAALLAIDDRIIYQALTDKIARQVDMLSASQVIWPRGPFDTSVNYSAFSRAPETWRAEYVVMADIESFYESINHSLLAIFLSSHLSVSNSYLHALEGTLRAVMGNEVGLPQGPVGSDVLSSAFLMPVDRSLAARDWEFVRYADDFLIGANSIVDGRRKIEQLEILLRDIGLRLNPSKTKVMRVRRYLDALDNPSSSVEGFRREVRDILKEELRTSEDPEAVEGALRQIGANEEIFWSLLYHQTTTIDEVLEEVEDLLTPDLVESYARYFARQSSRLKSDELPSDVDSIERDLKECLTFLASARRPVDIANVDRALLWFPRLAEYVAVYLTALPSSALTDVRWFLLRWLSSASDTDWVTAWICNVASRKPAVINHELTDVLNRLALDDSLGSLTRSEAVRALAEARRLSLSVWSQVIESVKPAARSELFFSAIATPGLYPGVLTRTRCLSTQVGNRQPLRLVMMGTLLQAQPYE